MKTHTIIKTFIMFACIGMFSCSKNSAVTTPKETVLYQTNFSSNDGKWAVGSISQGGGTYYQNGIYLVVGGRDASTFTYSYIANVFTGSSGNIAVMASVKPLINPTDPDSQISNGGLIWNCQVSGQNISYDVFEISSTGEWGIFKFQRTDLANNLWTISTISDWTINSAISQNQFNNLQVLLNGGQLQFSVNGIQVYKMNTTGNTLDQVGLFADVHGEIQANSFQAVEWE